MSARSRLAFWSLIVLGAAIRVAIALANYKSLMAAGIYQEDAFYYLKIAQNVVQGRGMTFDTLGPTNGFHPLYMLLLLPVLAWSGGSLVAPIHGSELILAAVGVATGFLVFALGRTWMGVRGALVGLAFWAVSPYFVVFGVNGLETGLAMLFAVAVMLLHARWLVPDGVAPLRKCVLFGAVCGLAVLARFDLVLLLAALALDGLLGFMRTRRRAVLRCTAVWGLAALAVWMPWGVASRLATGHFAPTSGPASRQIALDFGWQNLDSVWTERDPERRFFDPQHVPPAYYADTATRLFFVALHEYPPLSWLRIGIAFDVWPRLDDYAPYALFRDHRVAGSVLLALAAALFALRLRARDRPVVLYLVAFFAGYAFLVPVHWYYNRYLTPPILLATVYGLARIAAATSAPRRRRPAVHRAAWGLAALALALQLAELRSLSILRWHDVPVKGSLRDWQRFEPLIDRTQRIGAFQAGIFAYFSGLDVVNLDGKVNDEARRALRDRELARYLREHDIRYVMDWEWVFYCLCGRHLREGELRIHRLVEGRSANEASLYLLAPEEVRSLPARTRVSR